MVAKKHPVKFQSIKKWCAGENHSEVYQEFLDLLKLK